MVHISLRKNGHHLCDNEHGVTFFPSLSSILLPPHLCKIYWTILATAFFKHQLNKILYELYIYMPYGTLKCASFMINNVVANHWRLLDYFNFIKLLVHIDRERWIHKRNGNFWKELECVCLPGKTFYEKCI